MRIAIVWPIQMGRSAEIFRRISFYFEIISYKRILISGDSGKNFIDQIPDLNSNELFSILFNTEHNKYNPIKVYLLKPKTECDIDVCELRKECLENSPSNIYISKNHLDTLELSKTIFNRNSLDCIKMREREKFNYNLNKEILFKNSPFPSLTSEDIVLANESTFYIYGYQKCHKCPYYSEITLPFSTDGSSLLIEAPKINILNDTIYTFSDPDGHYTN